MAWTPKKTENPKPSGSDGTEVKQPHQIPDPPPPQEEPETPREPKVVSTPPASEEILPLERVAVKHINEAIKLLEDINSDQAILAIGKLKGALIKLDA